MTADPRTLNTEEARYLAWHTILEPAQQEVIARMRRVYNPTTHQERSAVTRVAKNVFEFLQWAAQVRQGTVLSRNPLPGDAERLQVQLAGFDPLTFNYSVLIGVGEKPLVTIRELTARARGEPPPAPAWLPPPVVVDEQPVTLADTRRVLVVDIVASALEDECNRVAARGWDFWEVIEYVVGETPPNWYRCLFKREKP